MKTLSFIFIFLTGVACVSAPTKSLTGSDHSWTFTRELASKPRGGSSTGTAVTFDKSIPASWTKLQEKGISTYEKDRRAIYALEGEYRTTFEFLETFVVDPNKKLDQPYASWATEYIKVIEDTGDFISLQHIMVMYYKQKDSEKVIGPVVMKHWRQDWTWQPTSQWTYQGDNKWETKLLDNKNTSGKWLWEVFQVDDSPRYSGLGQWDHFSSTSLFNTEYMNRPLPRREHSVRSDYKLLFGKESLVLTPHAWYHEQKSFKQKEAGSVSSFLAREIGHNGYKRIKDFDFKAGQDYWAKTKNYWADVRAVWKEIFKEKSSFQLKKKVDGKPLYQYHFEQADDDKIPNKSKEERQAIIRSTIDKFLVK